ncbi:MAG: Cna B-type domain-containing protein [Clostridia bacterium]|nr:Cna B-type domain-containing protein [Clostridia bacterium]
MKKKYTLFSAFVLIVALLLTSVTVSASENNQLDINNVGSLSLTYANDNEIFSDVKVSIYRVADISDDIAYTLTGSFENYPIDINSASSDHEWQVLSYTLFSYVVANGVEVDKTLYTDENGMVKFEDIRTGLYLVLSEILNRGDGKYYFVPFLITNPYFINNEWYYDVVAKPKMQIVDSDFEGEIEKLVVTKRWKDSGYELYRPKEIVVDILKNGNVFSTQVLSAENNWTYSWFVPNDDSVWTVMEKSVKDFYDVTIDINGDIFNITNIYNDTPKDETSTDDETSPDNPQPSKEPSGQTSTYDSPVSYSDNSIVQTGLPNTMWHFMLLFVLIGMGFVLFGVVLRIKDN